MTELEALRNYNKAKADLVTALRTNSLPFGELAVVSIEAMIKAAIEVHTAEAATEKGSEE